MRTSFTEDEIKQASCLNMDNLLFYVDEQDRKNRMVIKKLKQICSECPIKLQCLEIAFNNEEYGIWGGTTERERWRIKRNANRAPQPAPSRRTMDGALRANRERSMRVAQEKAQLIAKSNKENIDTLPEDVQKLVALRLANPSIGLIELGLLMDPPLNKNQVAGKLRRALGKING